MNISKALFVFGLSSISSMIMAQDFAKQQVAGFYHQPLGQFQITALYDGYTNLPTTVFQGIDQQKVQTILDQHFVDHQSGVQTSVNAYLVNTGQKLILVDSGTAKCFGDTLGSIEHNLNAAGYQSEQVDAVLLTHLHPDHACGISAVEGQKSFPNAIVYVNQKEADFWLNADNLDQLPKERQELFKGTFDTIQQIVKPYQENEQFRTYKAGDQIVDGVEIVATYGHTVGHTSYLIQSGQNKLLVLGDVVHNHTLQFSQPEISFVYDYDATQAIQARKTQFSQAAKQGYLVAGAHLPFPGIGHIQQTHDQQFAWLPVQFNPNVKPQVTK